MTFRLSNQASEELIQFGFKVFVKRANGGSPGGLSRKVVSKFADLDNAEKDAWYDAITAVAMSVNSGKIRYDLFKI